MLHAVEQPRTGQRAGKGVKGQFTLKSPLDSLSAQMAHSLKGLRPGKDLSEEDR